MCTMEDFIAIIVTEIVKEIKTKGCIDRAMQEEMSSCFIAASSI